MDSLRLDAVAARVVAWHNRHPLARRITAAQVQSVGYVALPFAVAGEAPAAAPPVETGSLRERAMARARQEAAGALPAAAAPALVPARRDAGPPQAVFSDDFIATLPPRQVARWAADHGTRLPQPPTDGPVRQVLAAPAPAGTAPVLLYVLTAAIAPGGRSRRVLLGAGPQAAVLGRRLWSPWRAAVLGAPLVAVLLAVLLLGLRREPHAVLAGPQPAASGPAAVAAVASEPVRLAPVQPTEPAELAQARAAAAHVDLPVGGPGRGAAETLSAAAVPAERSASAVAERSQEAPAVAHAAPAPAASAPSAQPRLGRIELPLISDEAKAASRRQRVPAADAMAAVAPAPPAPVPAPAPAGRVSPGAASATATATAAPQPARGVPAPGNASQRAATAAATASQPSFALSTRPLRTRAEAEQVMAAMAALLRNPSAGKLHTDILPVGADWRVVGWPFARRSDADLARELLLARGMRVEVIGF